MATIVGVAIACFQQLCGINAFIMYSSQIFSSVGIEPAMATFLVNLANFIFVLPAIPLLNIYGRKSMMLFWTGVMVVSIVAMSVFTIWVDLGDTSNYIEITCTVIFVGAFELCFGPIPWLYIAEICTEESIAFATFMQWMSALIMNELTPYLLNDWIKNYTFLMFGAICASAWFFMLFFMKETKGKSEEECKKLYIPERLKANYASVENTEQLDD